MVLEQAVEYGYLDRNPAQGRKRLLRESRPPRSYLQPDQVAALLAAAGELDGEARAVTPDADGRCWRPSRWRGCGSARRSTCAGAT
jgi:hypothetical protein